MSIRSGQSLYPVHHSNNFGKNREIAFADRNTQKVTPSLIAHHSSHSTREKCQLLAGRWGLAL